MIIILLKKKKSLFEPGGEATEVLGGSIYDHMTLPIAYQPSPHSMPSHMTQVAFGLTSQCSHFFCTQLYCCGDIRLGGNLRLNRWIVCLHEMYYTPTNQGGKTELSLQCRDGSGEGGS